MKAISLFSGGKDSFFSALVALEQGFDIQYAVTIDPEEYSMMFHFPNTMLADLSARLLGMEVRHVQEKDFSASLEKARDEGIKAVVSGAIASEYQKTRIEELCTDLGMTSFTPMWRKDQYLLMDAIMQSGIGAMIVSVSAEGLEEEDLGKSLDGDFVTKIRGIDERIGINPAGEGGEYETYVRSLEGSGRVVIDRAEKQWKGSGGYYSISEAHFER